MSVARECWFYDRILLNFFFLVCSYAGLPVLPSRSSRLRQPVHCTLQKRSHLLVSLQRKWRPLRHARYYKRSAPGDVSTGHINGSYCCSWSWVPRTLAAHEWVPSHRTAYSSSGTCETFSVPHSRFDRCLLRGRRRTRMRMRANESRTRSLLAAWVQPSAASGRSVEAVRSLFPNPFLSSLSFRLYF